MGDARRMFRAWWHDPADYRWLVHTLTTHTALRWVKAVVASGGVLMALNGLLKTFSPAGPQGVVGHTIVWIGIGLGVLWAVRWWLLPWPREFESLTLVATADITITVSCLQDTDRVYGATGAILLVVTGGYLTFFHSAKVLAAHACWSLLTVLILAARMVLEGGSVWLAGSLILIMMASVVMVLPTLQFVYWLLRTESLSDPLTTLLNRRGLEYQLDRKLNRGGRALCVISVDLDRFKTVNDTFGHQIGDQVLVRTAQRLRSAVDPGTVVARVGGEEFVVIGRMAPPAARAAAERLRIAVAELDEPPVPVTASIGVAVFDGANSRTCPDGIGAHLLHAADTAMYQAKRGGGNLVVLSEVSLNDTNPAPLVREAGSVY